MALKHVRRIPVRQSFKFTMNKIPFKVFGAMSKDLYSYIYECFCMDTAVWFIRKRHDKFIDKFCATDKLLCRAICGRQWLTLILNCLFFSLVYYVRLVCSSILFNLLFSATTCLVKKSCIYWLKHIHVTNISLKHCFYGE